MTKEILAIIEEQIINKTLNLDAIAKVKDILDENKNLQEANKDLIATKKENIVTISNQASEIFDVTQKLLTLQLANGKLTEEAKKVFEDNIRNEFEVKRGNEMKEIVGMALRNPTITRSRFGGRDMAGDHGMVTYGSTNETETEDVT